MPEKITTADCKQAIAEAWTEIFGADLADQAGKWKRISKKGKKGGPVERVFHHESLPLQALVVEKDGAISESLIRGVAWFEYGDDFEPATESESAMYERSSSDEAMDLFSKYSCFKPSDFTFRMCTEAEAVRDGGTWYELYPKRNFGREDASNDQQLDYLIDKFLPEGDGEVMEGTFSSERSVVEARAELIRLGFAEFKPGSGFVFFLITEPDECFGVASRKDFEEFHGLPESDSEGLMDIMPPGFHPCAESVWDYRGSIAEGLAILLALGFEQVEDPNK